MTFVSVGVSGAFGSGKSTLCSFVETCLQHHGLSCVNLSIDDFYLSKEDRTALSKKVHPLLRECEDLSASLCFFLLSVGCPS